MARDGFRTGQKCRGPLCQVIGAAKSHGESESDFFSTFCGWRRRVKGGGEFKYLKMALCVGDGEMGKWGNGNWVKWFKLRGVGVKLTQRYLTALGGEVWARRDQGTEET